MANQLLYIEKLWESCEKKSESEISTRKIKLEHGKVNICSRVWDYLHFNILLFQISVDNSFRAA